MSGQHENVADWRRQLLNEFTSRVARLTLVADPDKLLLEETLLAAIRERGFELITFEDNASFRFAYESEFRSQWDRDRTTSVEVVVRVNSYDLAPLPYDILQAGRRISFGLAALFPDLSYPVVASVDRSDLDALYDAQERHDPKRLGDDATKDFVLLHVFEIAPALVKHPADLLRVLLRRHYRRQLIPHLLDDRLIHLLRKSGAFNSWPLETIVPDREAFFSFLQERWPLFLDRLAGKLGNGWDDDGGTPRLKIGGPSSLPFDHHDVHIYIDNLFVEGMLRPVPYRSGDALSSKWLSVGISSDPIADRFRRLEGLLETASVTIPGPEARHRDWSAFAYRWAEVAVLWSETNAAAQSELSSSMLRLRADVDRAFLTWMKRRYAGLHNQPPDPPAMVHHLPRYLGRRLSDIPGSKVALVVTDGLAIDQWVVLRDVLRNQRPRLRFHEDTAFAWVPTITSVSRQAIFAGKAPLYFPSSIRTTAKEESLWTQFWADNSLAARETAYMRGLGDGPLDAVRELLARPELRALGLVVDKVDRIMHGMELGMAGMHNQVRQWAHEGFMAELLDVLLDCDFSVILTSDHGNIEAEGCGRPSEGAIADIRGERVRIYPDPMLRSRVKERFPDAVTWPALGLPNDWLALFAPDRSAFVRKGERIVGHGGISLEEVVVPMVTVEREAE